MMPLRWSGVVQRVHGLSWPRVQRGCVRQFKRWSWAAAGALLGSGAVFWLASDTGEAHEQARQAVDAARQRLQALAQPSTSALRPVDTSASPLWSRLGASGSAETWTRLQQTLSARGVQVVSIRVAPGAHTGPLASQSVALRLQAPFADWVSTWQGLSQAGPVLSIDRISAAPMASAHGISQDMPRGVQLDVVMRLWFKPDAQPSQASEPWPEPQDLPVRVAASGPLGAEVFAHLGSAPGVPAVSASPAASAQPSEATPGPADPLLWPLARLRLLGTWQQGAQWQAVLGAAGAWVAVRPGQRIASEGHRVESIQRDAVLLRSTQGQALQLTWSGGGQ